MHAAVRYTSLALAAFFATSLTAAAQSNAARSTTRGLMLDLHLNGSSIKAEGGPTESGGGIGARVGYGFSPRITGYLGYDRARIESADAEFADSYSLGQFDLGLQYNFANNDRAWRPFVEAAATRRSMYADMDFGGQTYDITSYGYGMSMGGGVQYYFTAPWALNLGLNYTFGKFTKGEMDGQTTDLDPAIKATGARFNIGMTWHPMAGR